MAGQWSDWRISDQELIPHDYREVEEIEVCSSQTVKCIKCNKCPICDPKIILVRLNEKGVPGIWVCQNCQGEFKEN